MTENLKTAIVGLGVIGNVHINLAYKQGLNLVAVCDVDKTKLSNIDGVEKYTDYIDMLDSAKPNVVHICTPHYLHADMIIEALNRNINVLCEKPLCIKEQDITRIIDAEKRSKAQLGVCHQNRYNKENAFVKDYLKDKNVVGGFGSVVWNRCKEYYMSADWRGKWDTEGGGVLINQALHTLDLMIWLIGMPTKLSSDVNNLTLKKYIEVEDTATIICSGEKKFTFFATNGGCCDFPVGVTVKTDKEIVSILKNKVVTDDNVYKFPKDTAVYGKCCYGTGHDALIQEFYECVKSGKKFDIDGQEASKVIRLILAAYKSGGDKVEI
ncbi:MAG: Gfo/Idh/MocA family oxidoreductase [Clostridia bacterium]|nr:Gfo/Idh/MocA family oxidoreductase [Clostridia bacterium]